jgi:hypothetical protein
MSRVSKQADNKNKAGSCVFGLPFDFNIVGSKFLRNVCKFYQTLRRHIQEYYYFQSDRTDIYKSDYPKDVLFSK